MNSNKNYYSIITDIELELIENAYDKGEKIILEHVGDLNGIYAKPDPAFTELVSVLPGNVDIHEDASSGYLISLKTYIDSQFAPETI